jgi:leucyl aminopeptidase
MIEIRSINLKRSTIETLVIPICEDTMLHEGPLAALIEAGRGIETLKGESGEMTVVHRPEGFRIQRLIFIGLGKAAKVDAEALRKCAGRAVKYAMERQLKAIDIATPAPEATAIKDADALSALTEGACLANQVFDQYKQEKKLRPLEKIRLLTAASAAKVHQDLVRRAALVCEGSGLARTWVSTPSNHKVPEVFARTVADAGRQAGLKVSVMDEKVLLKKGFGAMLAVAAGSRNRPALVILEHKPKGARKTIALVGKGVTFDSGGINLKPSGSSIEEMKMDMAGAAAVAAALITAARLNADVHIVGALPLVENMPSGSATRPGDIVKTYAGKTVEIGNTDAEGRLILADTLAYIAEKYNPDAVIDLATLTGACVVALGEKIAGLFTADDELAETILAAAGRTGERCWRLPLPEDYKEQLKSEFADLSNMGATRWGGAITAALFLSAFVEKSRWAHIDIAGPAYVKKPADYGPAGGTGFGVRLLADLFDRL